MSQLTPFVQHKKLTLTRDGRHIQYPATGSFFMCKEALSPFEMQFDDQGWFVFDQGLAFLYGFNHEEAGLSFEQAARIDQHMAMAYWGIALVLGPNYNLPGDEERWEHQRPGNRSQGCWQEEPAERPVHSLRDRRWVRCPRLAPRPIPSSARP